MSSVNNVQAKVLFDKWVGNSEKLSAALFSLARKIQPCIIFIDEIGTWKRCCHLTKMHFVHLQIRSRAVVQTTITR